MSLSSRASCWPSTGSLAGSGSDVRVEFPKLWIMADAEAKTGVRIDASHQRLQSFDLRLDAFALGGPTSVKSKGQRSPPSQLGAPGASLRVAPVVRSRPRPPGRPRRSSDWRRRCAGLQRAPPAHRRGFQAPGAGRRPGERPRGAQRSWQQQRTSCDDHCRMASELKVNIERRRGHAARRRQRAGEGPE